MKNYKNIIRADVIKKIISASALCILLAPFCISVWTGDLRITNDNAVSDGAEFAVGSGGETYIVWHDNRTGSYQLYFKKITTYPSFNLATGDVKITNASVGAVNPAIFLDASGNLHVAWQDYDPKGRWEIYYKKINTGGETLINATKVTKSAGDSMYPDIITKDGIVYIFWMDNSTGNFEIYYDRGIDSVPYVSINASTTHGNPPLSVQFNASVSGGDLPLSYFWDFGDGTNSSQLFPVHNFTSYGIYNVFFKVADNNGDYDTKSVKINVGCTSNESCLSHEFCNLTTHSCRDLICQTDFEPFNHQCYHKCDLDQDGIITKDWSDLMAAYKCFLRIEKTCKINYQDWANIKSEYNCFVGNLN